MPTVSAYVNDATYAKYQEVAAAQNLSVSKVINQAFDDAEIVDTKLKMSVEFQRNVELHRIGNNLNQIAKYVNIHKVLDEIVLDSLLKIQSDAKKI